MLVNRVPRSGRGLNLPGLSLFDVIFSTVQTWRYVPVQMALSRSKVLQRLLRSVTHKHILGVKIS